MIYFYPRPPGGGRLLDLAFDVPEESISIHALRVEGDRHDQSTGSGCNISIHALRVEGDFFGCCCRPAPRISIHALRVEGDAILYKTWQGLAVFLSTPSGWRATKAVGRYHVTQPISIHALRVEGDPGCHRSPCFPSDISIHALRVEGDSSRIAGSTS